MSKFKVGDLKVGDRVLIEATLTAIDDSDTYYPWEFSFNGHDATWITHQATIRRLIPKRRKPRADRVMVAAALMPFIAAENPRGVGTNFSEWREFLRKAALLEADALIAEGAK